MKTSAIIRIVAWSIVAVVLGAVLWAGFTFQPSTFFSSFFGDISDWGFSIGGDGYYQDAELYTRAQGEVRLANIHTLDIHWRGGEVRIAGHDNESVVFSESGMINPTENMQMHYLVQDGRLVIRYAQSTRRFDRLNSVSKTLTVFVPREALSELRAQAFSAGILVEDFKVDLLDFENISGDITLKNVEAQSCDAELVSGSIRGENLRILDISTETVSGDASLQGSFERISHESVSGRGDIESAVCPNRVRMESVSGVIKLRIPENTGFTTDFESVSGVLDSDFATTKQQKRYVYGDGRAAFSFESVSGDASILRLK